MSAPNLALRNALFVNYVGTDDAGYDQIGKPWSYRSITAALAALALQTNPPSATNPWTIAVGPGVFTEPGLSLPAWVWITGDADGETGQNTTILLSADFELSADWANAATQGGLSNLIIRAAEGHTPRLDFTVPTPAGNPARQVELENITTDIHTVIFHGSSTADVFDSKRLVHDGSGSDSITLENGLIRLNNFTSAAPVTIRDNTAATSAFLRNVFLLAGVRLTVSASAAAVTAKIVGSSIPLATFSETAPGTLALSADAISLPLRANITYAGTATTSSITRLVDANADGYSPSTPGNWPAPTPTTVQEALDDLSPGSSEGVDVEFTGALAGPMAFYGIGPASIIPFGTGASRAIYVPPSGVTLSSMAYTEYPSSQDGNHVLTLKVWNVISISGGLSPGPFTSITLFSFPALTSVGGSVNLINFGAALTTLDLSALAFVGNQIDIEIMGGLLTLSLAALVFMGGRFIPNTLNALTALSIPLLQYVGGAFQPQILPVLTTLAAPALQYVGGNFNPNTMALVTVFNFPALLAVGGTFNPATMAALVTLAADAMTDVIGAFSVSAMASLATASFAGMVRYGSTITLNSGLGNLQNMTLGTIGTLKSVTGATINASGQKLTAASVNAILALLVSLDGTGGTTLWGAGKTLNVSGGTSAAPSGAGITDKATLIGRGATVTTN